MRCINLLCFMTVIGLVGCSKTNSDNVETDGIFANIDVETLGEGETEVEVILKAGSGLGGTDLGLSSSDRLTATSNEVTNSLAKDSNLLSVKYRTKFSFDDQGTEFRVALERDDKLSAENSIVTLPSPFDLTGPIANTDFARDESVTFTWAPGLPGGNEMRIQFNKDCDGQDTSYTGITFRNEPDNGSYSINMSALLDSTGNLDDSGGCEVEAVFTRFTRGELDPNFGEGGSIEGLQVRTLDFSIATLL